MMCHSGISLVVELNQTPFLVWFHMDGQLWGEVLNTFFHPIGWPWNGASVTCRHGV